MSVNWNYFDRYNVLTDKYLPACGEGDTLATQFVTAVCKLVYKWYNDGDVYDNSFRMRGWENDLSSYANWLAAHDMGAEEILAGIEDCRTDEDYEEILKELADVTMNEEWLEKMNRCPKEGSIYECDGPFHFTKCPDEDDDLAELEWGY